MANDDWENKLDTFTHKLCHINALFVACACDFEVKIRVAPKIDLLILGHVFPHFSVKIGQSFSRVAEFIPRFPATSLFIIDGLIPAIFARSDWVMFFFLRNVITSSLTFMRTTITAIWQDKSRITVCFSAAWLGCL